MKKISIFLALGVLVLAMLACNDTPVVANTNCQPTAVSAVQVPIDRTGIKWADAGYSIDFCGITVKPLPFGTDGDIEYNFQGGQNAVGRSGMMLKVTFSDNSVKYFTSKGGDVYYSDGK